MLTSFLSRLVRCSPVDHHHGTHKDLEQTKEFFSVFITQCAQWRNQKRSSRFHFRRSIAKRWGGISRWFASDVKESVHLPDNEKDRANPRKIHESGLIQIRFCDSKTFEDLSAHELMELVRSNRSLYRFDSSSERSTQPFAFLQLSVRFFQLCRSQWSF